MGSAIHLFIEFTNWLQKENPTKDLGWCYQHPISIRFWGKIQSLTVQKHFETFSFNSELKQQKHKNYNGYN